MPQLRSIASTRTGDGCKGLQVRRRPKVDKLATLVPSVGAVSFAFSGFCRGRPIRQFTMLCVEVSRPFSQHPPALFIGHVGDQIGHFHAERFGQARQLGQLG